MGISGFFREPAPVRKRGEILCWAAGSLAAGILLGLFSKWLDAMSIDDGIWWQRIFGALDLRNIFSELPVWLLLGTGIAAFSGTAGGGKRIPLFRRDDGQLSRVYRLGVRIQSLEVYAYLVWDNAAESSGGGVLLVRRRKGPCRWNPASCPLFCDAVLCAPCGMALPGCGAVDRPALSGADGCSAVAGAEKDRPAAGGGLHAAGCGGMAPWFLIGWTEVRK